MDVITGHIVISGLNIRIKKCIINEGGNSSPLVFLHEGLGSIGQWKKFPEKICELTGRNGYVYDRPGYGGSDMDIPEFRPDFMEYHARDFLPGFLEEMNINKPIIIGHSDGGTIALLFAALYPDIPVGIITLAAHVFNERQTVEGIRKIDESGNKADLIKKLKKYHGSKAETVFRRWENIWLSEDFRGWRIEPELRKIKCPALALQGTDDPYGADEQMRLIEKHCRNCRTVLIENTGHAPHIESAGETLKKCSEFLEGI